MAFSLRNPGQRQWQRMTGSTWTGVPSSTGQPSEWNTQVQIKFWKSDHTYSILTCDVINEPSIFPTQVLLLSLSSSKFVSTLFFSLLKGHLLSAFHLPDQRTLSSNPSYFITFP